MKRFKKILWLAGVAMWLTVASGCNRDMYLFFDDGEFDSMEYNNEIMMINSELELDDMDR